MFRPKQVVNLDTDPLADRENRTAVVVADSEYGDWIGSGRYNVVCLTSDFDEYDDHESTKKLHKTKHVAVGELTTHSLICPWATLALPGESLRNVTTSDGTHQKIELTDTGHELVVRTVYSFFSSFNEYDR